jgi:predicted metal-binding membrane protein
MFDDPRDSTRVCLVVLAVCVLAWTILLLGSANTLGLVQCPLHSAAAMPPLASLRMLSSMNSPTSMAAGWMLMLVAMMAPVLILPIRYLRVRSFTHRRARSTALFVLGYAAPWMVVGGALLAMELLLQIVVPRSSWPPIAVLLLALVWQFSPLKQHSLNRCHAHTELAAFGAAADRDAVRFGIVHGLWCAVSCWALMLFPMLLPEGHMIAMAGVTLFVACERLEQPSQPCWRWRGVRKAARILLAQGRIHWQARTFKANAQDASL